MTGRRRYLRLEYPANHQRQRDIVALLTYLAHIPTPAKAHWQRDAQTADLLAGLIANDSL